MRVLTAALLGAVLANDPAPSASASAAPAADVHAVNAELSAHAAQKAAVVANQVTEHAQAMHENARVALHHARGALQEAKADAAGLTGAQHDALAKADQALEAATKKVEQETLEQSKWVSQTLEAADADRASATATTTLESQIAELEAKLAAAKVQGAAEEQTAGFESELGALKAKLEAHKHAETAGTHESLGKMRDDLAKLEHQVETMEDIHRLQKQLDIAAGAGPAPKLADAEAETAALRAELKELQDMVAKLSAGKDESANGPDDLEAELAKLKQAIAAKIARDEQEHAAAEAAAAAKAADTAKAHQHVHDSPGPGSSSGHGEGPEVDSEMPYGELEPFGREDTATELTEASIHESDRMVDQIERAEVAEEKRAVFRALTRLRGAAITSYDGIARSQTGNIDEYNHVHRWRSSHPLHHLADEESDVSKWAFPDNAD